MDSGILVIKNRIIETTLNNRAVASNKLRSWLIKCMRKGVMITTDPSKNIKIPDTLDSLSGKNSIK